MSRYEQETSTKTLPIVMAMIVIVSTITVVFWYQNNEQVTGRETTSIDIPIATANPGFKKQVRNQDVEKELVNLESAQIVRSHQALLTKPKLPELGESDNRFRTEIVAVSENLLDWFNVKDVIRQYILIINDLSQNQIIYKHRKFINVSSLMVLEKDSQGLYMAKASFRRYDRLANAIDAINVQKGLNLYLTFKPLFKQVYDEFSYSEAYSLDDIFMKAAASVIKAPVITDRIYLLKHSVRYKYADKKLEALNDVEKQMIRMGPVNTKKIQNKLRQLVETLSAINEHGY